MNPKQQQFVKEYLIDLNATQAAIRAGYSEKTAYSQGQRLLKVVEVAEAVAAAKAQRSERTQIDADWVLREAADLYAEARREADRSTAKATLDLIGKHTDVAAFEERVRQDVNIVDRTELLQRAKDEVRDVFGERPTGDGVGAGSGSLPH